MNGENGRAVGIEVVVGEGWDVVGADTRRAGVGDSLGRGVFDHLQLLRVRGARSRKAARGDDRRDAHSSV